MNELPQQLDNTTLYVVSQYASQPIVLVSETRSKIEFQNIYVSSKLWLYYSSSIGIEVNQKDLEFVEE